MQLWRNFRICRKNSSGPTPLTLHWHYSYFHLKGHGFTNITSLREQLGTGPLGLLQKYTKITNLRYIPGNAHYNYRQFHSPRSDCPLRKARFRMFYKSDFSSYRIHP